MLTVLSAIWTRFGAWIAAAGALAVALLAALNVGKAKAKADAAEQRASDREAIAVRQINEQREATQKQTEVIEGANDVQKDNSLLDDAAVIDRLHNDWSRD